ncbi:MAG: metallophosphoesterase [Parcubacteria group bacterium]
MIQKIIKRAFIFVIAFAGIGFYIWSETNIPAVRNVSISLADFPNEIKIVHISDAHGRNIPSDGRLMRAIRSFSPDVIVLTGDMIDKSTVNFKPVLNTIHELSLIAPTLFISGNHEWANPKGMSFVNSLNTSGATALINGARVVKEVTICGVDDMSLELADISAALSVNGRCDILLSHSPAISRSIKGMRIPLVLAGHTHGGQIRLPVFGALLLPDRDIPRHLVQGLVEDNGTVFYISSGLGTSVIPVRFMARAEINLITVSPE